MAQTINFFRGLFTQTVNFFKRLFCKLQFFPVTEKKCVEKPAKSDNAQLEANGMVPVTLTPSNYSDVLLRLLEKMDADTVYNEAYQTASDEVTSDVNVAAEVSSAAKQVSELKGQLDNYGALYQGLTEYTAAVNDAASRAKSLKLNMDTLYSN